MTPRTFSLALLRLFVALCESAFQYFHTMASQEDTKARRLTMSCCTGGVLSLCLGGFVRANPPEASLPQKHQAFFKAHCLDCHDSETREGKVDLETLPFRISTLEQAELWQKVLNALNSGEMPPEDSEQPGNTEKADFLDDLARTMVTARQALSDSGGKITMRRLNRREYRNTIEQLTGVKVDVGSLPTDGGSGTFDTVGASQFISSDQFEQYLKLGRQAIDEAFERQVAQKQPSRVFRVEPENTVNVQSRKKMKTLEETNKRYLLWKAEVDKAAQAPENQKVIEQIRQKYKLDDLTDNVRLYQNANLLKGGPDAKKFGFRDANAASFSYQGGYGRTYAYMKHYLELPHSDRGTYLKLAWGIQRIDVTPKPENVPPGTYKLRIRAGAVKGSDPSRHFIEIGHPQRINQIPAGFASKPLASLQVTGTQDSPEIIETTLVIGSKTPREFGLQERRPEGNQKALSREFYAYKRENGYGTPPAIWVDWIELEGPLSDATAAAPKTHRVEPENTANVKNLEIIKRLEDNYKEKWLPWTQWVDKAAKAAENQEIVAPLRKRHPDYDSDPVLKYRKADLLKGAPDPRDYGSSDPINAVAALYSPYRRYHSYLKHYAELPHDDRGAYLKLSRGVQRFDVRPDPKDVPPGTYKLRVRVGAVKGSDPARHFIEIGHPQNVNGTSPGFAKLLSMQPISGTIENPETIEVNVEIGAGTLRVVGIQERQPKSAKLLRKDFERHKQKNGYGPPPAIWVDWMELEGPITESAAAESKILRVEPEKTINPANEQEIAQTEAQQERFKQWKKGVDEAAKTPENQVIIAEIRKTDRLIDHPNRFYTFADRLKGTPDPRDFGFSDAKKAAAADPSRSRSLALHKHYVTLPHRDRGTYLKLAHGTGRIIVPPKKKEFPPGSYVMRVRVGAVEGTPAERRFIQVGHPQRLIESRNWGFEGPAISTHQVTGTIDNPETIEIPLEVTAETIREFAVQEKQPNNGNLKALWNAHNEWKTKNGYGHPPAIWIDWVELEGPHSASKAKTRSPLQLVLDRNSSSTERQRARAIFTDFAGAAFREVKPEPDFIDRLIAIYETRRKAGDSFEDAIRTPLSVILASPGFLYLYEPGGDALRRQLNDRELAVRLSYFLWSGPPDAELLQLAEQNQLHLPEVLRQQVDRLIAEPRSDEFVAGFVHQWLDMQRLDLFQFDVNLHREFDESTRAATRREVYQSFAHLLRDSKDGRIGKLLKSDYVFVNGLLANYYGLEGVTGDEFRKIELPANSPRGGLLGMAAIHAMGSDGVVSSPVERGAWVLRHLLNDPPPPAPPNVPQLSRLADQVLTTRQRLLAHQEQAQCASCHRKIDPIGFGLENFNAAGKWRTTDHAGGKGKSGKTWTIDPSGALYKGPAFSDYHQLRDLIAEREEDFARGFTEHLIQYALGRAYGFTDEDLADAVVRSAKRSEYAVSEFVHALVQSQAFRTK
ncbi:Planctomycete cytochrome C [Stieleria bergensis]|uniref:Planctomycete cytochrome C n=2 Tax=Stieleria bergensis TaxID=2528025 RepID=A0A517SUD3_9BACT|nr:Planctomycete cytochrome C [Planctomycetes bacterium SV_7m_r]